MAYAAGIMDGEGCLTIKQRSASQQTGSALSTSYSGEVTVEMTDETTIRFLHELFGVGSIRSRQRVAQNKPVYVWRVTDAAARKVCWDILPYLRIKQRQAELIITLPVWPQGKGPVPEEVVTMKATMLTEMRSLNRVGA